MQPFSRYLIGTLALSTALFGRGKIFSQEAEEKHRTVEKMVAYQLDDSTKALIKRDKGEIYLQIQGPDIHEEGKTENYRIELDSDTIPFTKAACIVGIENKKGDLVGKVGTRRRVTPQAAWRDSTSSVWNPFAEVLKKDERYEKIGEIINDIDNWMKSNFKAEYEKKAGKWTRDKTMETTGVLPISQSPEGFGMKTIAMCGDEWTIPVTAFGDGELKVQIFFEKLGDNGELSVLDAQMPIYTSEDRLFETVGSKSYPLDASSKQLFKRQEGKIALKVKKPLEKDGVYRVRLESDSYPLTVAGLDGRLAEATGQFGRTVETKRKMGNGWVQSESGVWYPGNNISDVERYFGSDIRDALQKLLPTAEKGYRNLGLVMVNPSGRGIEQAEMFGAEWKIPVEIKGDGLLRLKALWRQMGSGDPFYLDGEVSIGTSQDSMSELVKQAQKPDEGEGRKEENKPAQNNVKEDEQRYNGKFNLRPVSRTDIVTSGEYGNDSVLFDFDFLPDNSVIYAIASAKGVKTIKFVHFSQPDKYENLMILGASTLSLPDMKDGFIVTPRGKIICSNNECIEEVDLDKNIKMLLDGKNEYVLFSCSPDSENILMATINDLYILNTNSRNIRKLKDFQRQFMVPVRFNSIAGFRELHGSWFSGGRKLAYLDPFNVEVVNSIDIETGKEEKLADVPNDWRKELYESGQASVSPDGRYILFSFGGGHGGATHTYIQDLQTNQLKLINEANMAYGGKAIWHPSSQFIFRVDTQNMEPNGSKSFVHEFNLNGDTLFQSEILNIPHTNNKLTGSTEFNIIRRVRISPDGTKLLIDGRAQGSFVGNDGKNSDVTEFVSIINLE